MFALRGVAVVNGDDRVVRQQLAGLEFFDARPEELPAPPVAYFDVPCADPPR
jgi:hypothetical protein